MAPVLTPSGPSSRSPDPAMTLAHGKSGEFAVPYTMSERDVLLGFVSGAPPRHLERLPPSGPTPRALLEQILAEELSRQTCFVSFSGGRDSSGLLAVALNVARRQGLPEPVALTLRYSENSDTEESAWQRLVVDHLRPKAWEIVEVAPDAAEFLAPPASHPSGPMVCFGPRRCTSRPGGWVAPAAPQSSPERAATRSSALTVPAQFGPF